MPIHNLRDKQGKFRSRTPQNIVAGRLYGFRGAIVRAGNDRQTALTGSKILRHVSFHKVLHGFVPEKELEIVNRTQVDQYLQKA